ncbi:MAG TPA: superoxide dismutase, partial [Methanomicrobiales archaeon]|nr:superoxide dismutase [Methanomicrobiales archaeon]
ALEPSISERQLRLHHDKHHQAYVNGANAILERLDKSRKENTLPDMRATLKELAFNIGGHLLHSLYWGNMAPAGGMGGGQPEGRLAEVLESEFGSFERFKKEFTAATSVEGSGWATLTFCRQTKRPIIMQIEKHSNNVYPMFTIILALDLWEHAYYLDYQNDRGKYVDAFWNIVNWEAVGRRLDAIPEAKK